MLILLFNVLHEVGLNLNVSITKNLHDYFCGNENLYDTMNVAGNIVENLYEDLHHKYLERYLDLLHNRADFAFTYRKQQAWYVFKEDINKFFSIATFL